jgi:uncharacterized protein YhaN
MSLRLEQFELRAFGPFTGTVLELEGSPGALHIICGPNEVGKSTAQRAIGDFLFGIPARSTDNQLHDYADMRLGAVLVDANGARHELSRRKGARSTLLGADGQPVDEGCLERMLRGLSRDAFESMFSITHESLVIGGKALLAAGGEVGESLFSASLGASSLHQLREQLDAEASALFRPRATSSLILQARSKLDAAEAQLRESTLRASTFIENERQSKATASERGDLAERLRSARAAQNGRGRLRSVIPLLVEREQVQLELAEIGDVPALPNDCAERRVRAVERAANGQTALTETGSRAKQLKERISALGGHDPLLARELAIKDLNGRIATIREGAVDLERQAGKLNLATDLAQRALATVRPDLDLDAAGTLLLTSRQRTRIDAALEERARLVVIRDQAEVAAGEAGERARELRLEIDSRPDSLDTTALEAAVDEAQAEGQLEHRLHEAEEELHAAEEQLASALGELHPSAELDALRDQPYPTATAVEQFALDRDELSERHRRLRDHRERLDTEQRQLDEDRARLTLDAEIPTMDALTLSRSERATEWAGVRRRLEGDTAAIVSPDTFEQRVHHADGIADALRRHADAAARAAELTIRERRLQADDADRKGLVESLDQDQLAHEQRWTQAWSAVLIQPRPPREMSEWLRQRQMVLDRALTVTRRQRAVESLQRTCDMHHSTLTDALAMLHCPHPADAALSRLLSLAQATIAAAQAEQADRLELSRELQTVQATAARQRAKAQECSEGLDAWATAWGAMASANGWPDDVGPADARQLLEAIDELARQLTDMTQLSARVDGIKDRIATFSGDATALIAEVAPDLASWPVLDAVAELARQLDTAIKRRSQQETLESQLEVAREELEAAERTVEQAGRDLAELMTLAGVQTIEELPAVEQRAGRLQLLIARLPEIERQVAETGQAPLADIIGRAAGVELDVLDAEVDTADEELTQLEQQLAQLDMQIGELGSERQTMERAAGAADAGQIVEQHRAELRELVDRYLRVQIAAWALAEAIDEYRREHKDPLLRRADELFPQLTCGSFSTLEVGFDEGDEPVLVGVRPNGERVPVKRMSTGTREQLYLALRLASLERHVELHGPMPVILDDVVLHSDPKRKTAILRALAELGRNTQVIAFSHDPQVVALVQNAVDPELVTLHELGEREITNALHPATGAADVHPIRKPQAA